MVKNSDILYLYDARLTNPNGDPDDENRPRMDFERFRNLVSDVRLKRYIRDYLEEKGHEIFVSKDEGKTINATRRLELLAEKNDKKLDELSTQLVLENLTDVRLFGATMPIQASDDGKGSSLTFTGPVQFNWGYSLHEVELVESNSITSHFSSESKNEQGAIGKDYRLYYSLVGFHGVVSGMRAEKTNLKEEDLKLLRSALKKAIPMLATRSKIGQYPRFILQVEYSNKETFIGDLRDYVQVKSDLEDKKIRDIDDYILDISQLLDRLKNTAEDINKIYYWQDDALKVLAGGREARLEELLKKVNLDSFAEKV